MPAVSCAQGLHAEMGNACTSLKQEPPAEPVALSLVQNKEPTDLSQPSEPSRERDSPTINVAEPAILDDRSHPSTTPEAVLEEAETESTTIPEVPQALPEDVLTTLQANSQDAPALSTRADRAEAPLSTDTPPAAAKENLPPLESPPLDAAPTPHAHVGPPANYRARRRGSVSAEVASLAATSMVAEAKPRRSLRTEQTLLRAMTHSFLFSDMEEEQKLECTAAMFRKEVRPTEVVIRQGEEGDNFYVIAEGVFTVCIRQPEGEEKIVFTYDGKGAFGELALMYNCPRAATVEAQTDGLLWAMDRSTFRRIILASRIAQRERFELVLSRMSVFASLSPVQRASIADCLVFEIFEEGTTILKEGEELTPESKFYIVEDGTVACYRSVLGEEKLVKEIEKGSFFGEVALVTRSSKRAATCMAKTRCKLLAMGRDAFERLMGPAEDILQKEVKEYERLNDEILRQAVDETTTSPPARPELVVAQQPAAEVPPPSKQGSSALTGKPGRQSSGIPGAESTAKRGNRGGQSEKQKRAG